MTTPPEDRVAATPARVDVTVLGRILTLRTDATPEYLRTLAEYVEQRVATLERAGARDPFTALALAALDIADELFRARTAARQDARDLHGRLDALLALIDDMAVDARESA